MLKMQIFPKDKDFPIFLLQVALNELFLVDQFLMNAFKFLAAQIFSKFHEKRSSFQKKTASDRGIFFNVNDRQDSQKLRQALNSDYFGQLLDLQPVKPGKTASCLTHNKYQEMNFPFSSFSSKTILYHHQLPTGFLRQCWLVYTHSICTPCHNIVGGFCKPTLTARNRRMYTSFILFPCNLELGAHSASVENEFAHLHPDSEDGK